MYESVANDEKITFYKKGDKVVWKTLTMATEFVISYFVCTLKQICQITKKMQKALLLAEASIAVRAYSLLLFDKVT